MPPMTLLTRSEVQPIPRAHVGRCRPYERSCAAGRPLVHRNAVATAIAFGAIVAPPNAGGTKDLIDACALTNASSTHIERQKRSIEGGADRDRRSWSLL